MSSIDSESSSRPQPAPATTAAEQVCATTRPLLRRPRAPTPALPTGAQRCKYEEKAIINVTFQTLPGGSHRVALVHLAGGDPSAPVTWSEGRLRELTAALDEVAGSDSEAVVLVGTDYAFGVGADLDELGAVTDETGAASVARLGWRTFRRLSELPVPSLALLTGYALGGGFELALFADYRLARADLSGIGLPEARLGLVPGWGGVHRLARVSGPQTAVEMALFESLAGRFRTAPEALDAGIIDAVIAPGEWDEGWQRWLAARLDERAYAGDDTSGADVPASDVTGPGTRPSADPVAPIDADPDATWGSAVASARQRAAELPAASAVAAEAVLELLVRAQTETLDEAESATSELFARLLTGPDARAALYADRLLRTRARARKATDKHGVGSAAVIGAGLMAAQLATLLVQHAQIPVILTDTTTERAEAGARRVRARLLRAEKTGKLPAGDAERLGALVSSTTSLEDIAGVDFVIEAIFEELEAKRAAFAEAERWIGPNTVLATNTSSLSITALAEGLRHPERVVGFHVFNPVSVVPLVEIIPAGGPRVAIGPGTAGSATNARVTNESTLAVVSGLAAKLRRRPVHSADRPGFIVNRLITRLLDVVSRAIDAGADPVAADRATSAIGLPMTPLQLVDFVGPAVQLHVSHTMHEAYPARFARPLWLERLVARGAPGDPTRVYDAQGSLTPAAEDALPGRAGDSADRVERLLDEVLDALSEEIHVMLYEGVVASVEDIDVALLLGANYPRARGGLTPYLDATGASTRSGGRPFHP